MPSLDTLQLTLADALAPISRPLADVLGLTKLPPHLPLLLGSALTFWGVQVVVSPLVSSALSPSYRKLKRHRDRRNWDTHIVSLVHALIILPLSVRTFNSPSLNADRVFGWDPKSGTLQAVACGYFLWDSIDSIVHFQGPGFVVHGVVCFVIYLLGYKPFICYYGPRFLFWELSTPFLDVHWLLDKMDMTGSRLQFANGAVLLSTFAGARLVYGTIQSLSFYRAMLAIRGQVPLTVQLVYCVGNVALNSLNWYWFTKMVQALRKRMKPSAKKGKENGKVNGKAE